MGQFLQRDLMLEASLILQDDAFTRWTLPTLNLFINGALREILLHKPNAFAQTVQIELVPGALQQMPDEYPVLLRLVRNLVTASTTAPGNPTLSQITLITRQMLDAINPFWSDPSVTRQQAAVRHFMFDVAQPDRFYVYPPNNGAGIVEAIAAVEPPPVTAPALPQATIEFWNQPIPIKESYRQSIVDYMLFRAFSMDQDIPNMAQRAMMHRQAFEQALGIKYSRESMASPKTTYATPAVDG